MKDVFGTDYITVHSLNPVFINWVIFLSSLAPQVILVTSFDIFCVLHLLISNGIPIKIDECVPILRKDVLCFSPSSKVNLIIEFCPKNIVQGIKGGNSL